MKRATPGQTLLVLVVGGLSAVRANAASAQPAREGRAGGSPSTSAASVDGATRARARTAFEAAQASFQAHDYLAAVEAFRKADRIVPSPEVRFNVAVCLERLGRLREAVDEYVAASRDDRLPESARRRARTAADRLRERTPRLSLRSDPSGALARVGSDHCRTPCRLALDPGRHVVRFSFAGRTLERDLELTVAQNQELTVLFPPAPTGGAPVPEPVASPGPRRAGRPRAGADAPEQRSSLSPWGWTGVAVTTVGVAGWVAFGLRTEALAADYAAAEAGSPGLADLRDEGVLFRGLTNGAIVATAVGAALVLVDVLLLGPPADAQGRTPSRQGLTVRF